MVHSFTVDSISSSENEKIRKETEKDPILSRALAFNRAGWPASKMLIDPKLYQMYNLRYDLQEIDGCLYKTDRLIIPKSCQAEYLKQLHAGHLSANTCKQKARTSIYWDNIDRNIEFCVLSCEVCGKYRRSKSKVDMVKHTVPQRPFQKIAMDIFEFDGKAWLIVVDYF